MTYYAPFPIPAGSLFVSKSFHLHVWKQYAARLSFSLWRSHHSTLCGKNLRAWLSSPTLVQSVISAAQSISYVGVTLLAINTMPPTTSLSPPPHVHVHRYLVPLPGSLSCRPPWHRPSQALGAPRCIARTVTRRRSIPRRH